MSDSAVETQRRTSSSSWKRLSLQRSFRSQQENRFGGTSIRRDGTLVVRSKNVGPIGGTGPVTSSSRGPPPVKRKRRHDPQARDKQRRKLLARFFPDADEIDRVLTSQSTLDTSDKSESGDQLSQHISSVIEMHEDDSSSITDSIPCGSVSSNEQGLSHSLRSASTITTPSKYSTASTGLRKSSLSSTRVCSRDAVADSYSQRTPMRRKSSGSCSSLDNDDMIRLSHSTDGGDDGDDTSKRSSQGEQDASLGIASDIASLNSEVIRQHCEQRRVAQHSALTTSFNESQVRVVRKRIEIRQLQQEMQLLQLKLGEVEHRKELLMAEKRRQVRSTDAAGW